MTAPFDARETPAQQALAKPAVALVAEEVRASLFKEINARRARVENPELLRRLRGL